MQMNAFGKYGKYVHVICAAVLVLVAFISTYYVFEVGAEELSGYRLIVCSLDVLGTIITLPIYIILMFDKRLSPYAECLMFMVLLEGLLLLCNIASWLSEDNPDRIMITKYADLGLTLICLLMAGFYWEYQISDLVLPKKSYWYFEAVFLVLLFAGLLLVMTNAFTHWVFDITDNAEFVDGPAYLVFYATVFVIFLMSIVTTIRYGKSMQVKAFSVLYGAILVVAIAIQRTWYGISVFYISFLLIIILIFGNFYTVRGRELTQKDAELTEERFNVMFSQIQPHFLYNALTSIMNIKGNPPETRDAIADFGSYLRGNLNTINTKHPIPVSKELDHVETYVNLEKLRFKERLNVEWHISDRRFVIPALTIQMLVENAIKHGVTQRQEGGTVKIITQETEDGHIVRIIDDGVGFVVGTVPNDGRVHVGVTSVRNRVETMVGGSVVIKSTPGVGTSVTVFVPK